MKAVALIVAVALLSACGNSGPSPERASATPPPASSAPASAASAAASATTTPAAANPMQLTRYDGYGDMRFGMDKAAFDHAWSGQLADSVPAPGSSCFYRRPLWVRQPRDFSFMFEDGRFVRYDVGTTKETAPGGGKVGMSEAQIRALYGAQVEEQPHKYEAGAKYLRVKAAQGDSVLLFETDAGGKVTRWRLGVPPQVDYVEGCA